MASPLAAGPRGLLLPGQVRPVPPSLFAVPNGLVGYWGLDPDCVDFSQELAFDLSGNSRNGSLNGIAAIPIAGQVGNALFLNGTTGYIDCGNVLDMPLNSFSIALWVNCGTQAAQNFCGVLSKQASSNTTLGYQITFNTSNSIGLAISDGTNAVTQRVVQNIADNNWHFFVGVCDRAKTTALAYLDGAAPSSSSIAAVGSLSTSANLRFGVRPDANGVVRNLYVGRLDDVRIYNRALDPWEVLTLYQAGLAGRRDAGRGVPGYADLSAAMMTVPPAGNIIIPGGGNGGHLFRNRRRKKKLIRPIWDVVSNPIPVRTKPLIKNVDAKNSADLNVIPITVGVKDNLDLTALNSEISSLKQYLARKQYVEVYSSKEDEDAILQILNYNMKKEEQAVADLVGLLRLL